LADDSLVGAIRFITVITSSLSQFERDGISHHIITDTPVTITTEWIE